jgi:hypothetical protein
MILKTCNIRINKGDNNEYNAMHIAAQYNSLDVNNINY